MTTERSTDVAEKRKAPKRHIRWMIHKDMGEVIDIESRAQLDPWSADKFVHHLRQRNCIGQVLTIDDEVVGHLIYELEPGRLHLLNFAIDPRYWRRGLGRMMVEFLIGKLSPDRRNRIDLEVRESNLKAQLFFKSMGFRAKCVLRDHFEDSDEDAFFFQYRVRATAEATA